ncbi:hypothetical protein B0H16DRAFT_1693155 [Mycena metata]|uniref:Uncharacterized protein n=1 Tax=Mycena metata TaxID=1033252 RepID=A0AAD7IL30_9AGAR|nr:hypothetical protein B0H16DRAFT_1693155 [Mycena metata]
MPMGVGSAMYASCRVFKRVLYGGHSDFHRCSPCLLCHNNLAHPASSDSTYTFTSLLHIPLTMTIENEMASDGTLPADFTTLNLSGQFLLNQTLSDADPFGSTLAHQGIDDAELPQAIAAGILYFNHYTNEEGSERIWVQQDIEGRPRSSKSEERILDWMERTRIDPVVGPVVSRIRRVKTHHLNPAFLRSGWTPQTLKYGVLHYEIRSESEPQGWSLVETWGIECLDPTHRHQRRFCRHLEFTATLDGGEKNNIERHLVYDYLGGV